MRQKTWLGFAIIGCVLLMGFGPASALTDLEKLGGLIYRDTNLSINNNQSCMTCHHPSAGFEDPANRRDPVNFPVSEGSVPDSFGGRNAPTSAYAGFSPVLHQVTDGSWVGGMFWDGRATGSRLGDPLAEQAQGPFLNPIEMGLANPGDVVNRVEAAPYSNLFLRVFPETSFSNVSETYDNIAKAIAAFERSTAVTKFTSKFDQFWTACNAVDPPIDVSTIGVTTKLSDLPKSATGILTSRQLQGLVLFNGKAKCAACHTTKSEFKDDNGKDLPPLFTDFTYDNLGIPTNPRVYFLAGGSPPDNGLGGFLKADYYETSSIYNYANYEDEYGKFKVPTLRNVAKSPPYGHNGYFPTLAKIVNFYNMRDVPGSGLYDPEVEQNINTTELGDLNLTADEEWSLVVFMQSLNDEG